jgi:hypothetical protein
MSLSARKKVLEELGLSDDEEGAFMAVDKSYIYFRGCR